VCVDHHYDLLYQVSGHGAGGGYPHPDLIFFHAHSLAARELEG